ncbi:MAG TPA: Lrp/AsnC family transcriptional regulator [Xanthomonadaceae bacterium]|jgi:Lrp/AsnC family leucine-responsive transcriptional regulator
MNNVQHAFDRIDLAILAVLQQEGRLTNAELAERVNLSASACLRRVQRLEADGVVDGYAARISPAAVGLGLQAFVRVQLRSHDAVSVQTFVERVGAWDDVVACHALTGDMDYLMHIVVEDLEHFSRFLLDHLLNDSGVADVNSSFVLRTVKQERALPLGHLAEPPRRLRRADSEDPGRRGQGRRRR